MNLNCTFWLLLPAPYASSVFCSSEAPSCISMRVLFLRRPFFNRPAQQGCSSFAGPLISAEPLIFTDSLFYSIWRLFFSSTALLFYGGSSFFLAALLLQGYSFLIGPFLFYRAVFFCRAVYLFARSFFFSGSFSFECLPLTRPSPLRGIFLITLIFYRFCSGNIYPRCYISTASILNIYIITEMNFFTKVK